MALCPNHLMEMYSKMIFMLWWYVFLLEIDNYQMRIGWVSLHSL